MKLALTILAAAIVASAALPAGAATITVGDHEILPEPNQKIPIYIVPEVGDPQTAGVLLNVQVADGGPEVGGVIDGPVIQYVQMVEEPDPISGDPHPLYTDAFGVGIFEAVPNHGHFPDDPNPPQVYTINTATLSGAVPGDGLLAVLTIDATGFPLGNTYDLHLKETHNNSTVLYDDTPGVNPLPLTITEGTIKIVPEPSTLVLLVAGGIGLAVCLRRRRKRDRQHG